MTVTTHPCHRMTPAQRRAFEQLAIGQDPIAGPKTIAALLKAGVIERGPDRIFGTGPFAVRVAQYFVPLPIHMQWCEWCSENVAEEI